MRRTSQAFAFSSLLSSLAFGSWKWAYERVSAEPPDVPECQRPGIRPTKR
jgi:hypothetical protein